MKIKPSVTQMQHITSKEFGERMDVVLDWIIAEDTAVIIDHHTKSMFSALQAGFCPIIQRTMTTVSSEPSEVLLMLMMRIL